jgi:hypothetical protein
MLDDAACSLYHLCVVVLLIVLVSVWMSLQSHIIMVPISQRVLALVECIRFCVWITNWI